jgi:predicted nucleotide-binding protein
MWMGRFGPTRTIILRERNCSVPSNLDGITRTEFSNGEIKATFVIVREVLVREGVLPPERR